MVFIAGKGRPSEYEERVKPYIKEISEWVKQGATLEQICKELEISKSVMCKYKNQHEELKDAFKKSRKVFVAELRGELARLAFKHTLSTVKIYTKKDETGQEVTYKEKTEKEVDGDIAALHLLLKNYDDDWFENRKNYELKKKELELKERQIEKDEW